jgi:hypothetical protein
MPAYVRRTICWTTWTRVGYRAERRSLAGPTYAGSVLLFRAEGNPGGIGATSIEVLHGEDQWFEQG